MKITMSRIVPLLFLSLWLGSAIAHAADTHRLALFLENDQYGRESAAVLRLVTKAFTDSRSFVAVERSNLDAVAVEKSLLELKGGDSGGISALEDIDKIAFVAFRKSRQEIVTNSGNKKYEDHYVIDVRLVDVRTARVEHTFDSASSAIAGLSGNMQEGAGLVAAFAESEGYSGMANFDHAPTPQAAAANLYENIRVLFPPVGSILKLDTKDAIVSLGASDGLTEGDLLAVIRAGEPMFSATGDLLAGFPIEVGVLKVTKVIAEQALCKVKKGHQALTEGDEVRLKQGGKGGVLGRIRRLPGLGGLMRKIKQ